MLKVNNAAYQLKARTATCAVAQLDRDEVCREAASPWRAETGH